MSETRRNYEFRILGPLEAAAGESPLALGGPKQRALLALLLLNANRVVSREHIVDALWAESPPRSAPNSVQVAIHGLRKLLSADRVLTQGTAYRLLVEPEELDLDRFERLLRRSESENPEDAAATLREALSQRRGVALADLASAPFVAGERERLEELQLTVLERRVDADLDLGRASELVPELEQLVTEEGALELAADVGLVVHAGLVVGLVVGRGALVASGVLAISSMSIY